MNKNDGKVIIEMLNAWESKDLDQMVNETELVENYSNRWIETISRGELLFASDEFYGLIKDIEVEVRLIPNKNLLWSKLQVSYSSKVNQK